MTRMGQPLTTDTTIARLAGRQFGLVTRHQLAAAGVSESCLRGRLDSGRLVRCGRAVYRLAGAPQTWEQRALAACLAAGAGAVLCGRSAASVWRLDLPKSQVLDVATPLRNGRGPAPRGVRIHQVRSLGAEDCTRVGALPVTALARTLIDLAAELEPAVVQRVVDDALVTGLVSPDRLSLAIARVGGRGRSGICALRSALSAWTDDARLQSVAEALAARLLAGSDLPPPVRQHEIVDARGVVGHADFAWPGRKVILEVDGFRWHAGPRARDRDSQRTNALIADGWTVVRVTPAGLERDGAAVLAALRRHLIP
jgi:very-short-patch-repair endonuclease